MASAVSIQEETDGTAVQQTKQSAEPIGVCSLISVSSTIDEGMANRLPGLAVTCNPSTENVEARKTSRLPGQPTPLI